MTHLISAPITQTPQPQTETINRTPLATDESKSFGVKVITGITNLFKQIVTGISSVIRQACTRSSPATTRSITRTNTATPPIPIIRVTISRTSAPIISILTTSTPTTATPTVSTPRTPIRSSDVSSETLERTYSLSIARALAQEVETYQRTPITSSINEEADLETGLNQDSDEEYDCYTKTQTPAFPSKENKECLSPLSPDHSNKRKKIIEESLLAQHIEEPKTESSVESAMRAMDQRKKYHQKLFVSWLKRYR